MRRVLFSAVVLAVFQALWPGLAAAQYVGVSKCRPCHLAQTKSWEETRMAKAFELLKPGVAVDAKRTHNLDPNKDYTSDPNCLSCHRRQAHSQPRPQQGLHQRSQLPWVSRDRLRTARRIRQCGKDPRPGRRAVRSLSRPRGRLPEAQHDELAEQGVQAQGPGGGGNGDPLRAGLPELSQ